MAKPSRPDAKVPAPREPVSKPVPQLMARQRAAVDASFQKDAGVRQAITENLKTLRADSEVVATRVQKAFATFNPSKLSAEELAKRRHVAPGADPTAVLEAVMIERADAIRRSTIEPTIALHRSGDLKSLMTAAPEGAGPLLGTISLEPLLNFISLKQTAYPVLATDTTYSTCRAEVEAQRILDSVGAAPKGPNGADGPKVADVPAEYEDADALVTDSVNLQMKSASSPEGPLAYSSIPNSAGKDHVQTALMQTFELRPGASDVTAYHDFNTLQIAFPHVWTQIFDGQLASLGQDLYHEYVKLKDFAGSNAADLQISTLDDLKTLLEEIRTLSQTVQDETPGELQGDGADSRSTEHTNSDLGNVGRGVLGAATGGLSLVFEWAFNELSKLGHQPRIIEWDDFPGPLPGRQDEIEVSFDNGAAPQGVVELVLKTDEGSHWKGIGLKTWDPDTSRFFDGQQMSNGGNVHKVTMPLAISQIAFGALVFSAEESPGLNPERYLLADLANRLKDRTRATFHWKR